MNHRFFSKFRILSHFLFFFFITTAANTQTSLLPWRDLPALFDVEGVADDDVLNVRARPDAGAEIIDTLAPDARGIEIIGIDESGKWGMIGLTDSTGWVSLRYLARQPGQDTSALPTPMHCFGTEPFWTLRIRGDGRARFSMPGASEAELSLQWSDTGANRGPSAYGVLFATYGMDAHAVIRRGLCHDGMSDSTYGLEIDAILSDAEGMRLISGCCSLASH